MTTLDPRALPGSFAIYSVEDDEESIRLSVNGQRIACWGANTKEGLALLKLEAARQDALSQPHPADERVVALATADQIVGQVEERFPNWRSYRDLIDCIDCTLADLRREAR